jgi:hypothetical protein
MNPLCLGWSFVYEGTRFVLNKKLKLIFFNFQKYSLPWLSILNLLGLGLLRIYTASTCWIKSFPKKNNSNPECCTNCNVSSFCENTNFFRIFYRQLLLDLVLHPLCALVVVSK